MNTAGWFTPHRRMECTVNIIVNFFSDSSKISGLVKVPLTVWITATEKFKKHAASEGHRNASVVANNFLSVMKSKQKYIGEQLSTAMAA